MLPRASSGWRPASSRPRTRTLEQRTLDLISKFEAKDIVEYDVVDTPWHVSFMLKLKKKMGFLGCNDKDIGEGKGDMGKGDSVSSKPELYDISTPTPSTIEETNHFVISLESPEGAKRKAQLNFMHSIFMAYPHTSSEPMDFGIHMLGRAKEHTGLAPRQRATFFSHYKLWETIITNQADAVICEDDAILVESRSIDTSTLPQDGITLLGGCIRTPGAWNREKTEFVDNLKFLDIVKNFKPGINLIDFDKFRWTNCLAYFLPWNMARELVEDVRRILDDGKGFRPVDIWLGKNIWMKYIHYPNIFIDMDDSVTQVNSPKGHQKADFYICEYMRRAAAEQSIRLSKRGSSSLLD